MKPTKGSVNTGTKPDQSTKEEKKTKKREAECEAIGVGDAPLLLGAPTRRLSNWIVLRSSKLHNHPASRCALQHNSILVTDYSETPSLSHQKRPARTSGPGARREWQQEGSELPFPASWLVASATRAPEFLTRVATRASSSVTGVRQRIRTGTGLD